MTVHTPGVLRHTDATLWSHRMAAFCVVTVKRLHRLRRHCQQAMNIQHMCTSASHNNEVSWLYSTATNAAKQTHSLFSSSSTGFISNVGAHCSHKERSNTPPGLLLSSAEVSDLMDASNLSPGGSIFTAERSSSGS